MSYIITALVSALAGFAAGALVWRKNGVKVQSEIAYWKARASEVKEAIKGGK